MATIAENRARLEWVIDYLESGSSGKFLDAKSIEEIVKIFGLTAGFKCGCPGTLSEGLRDTPFSSLLKILLAADSQALVVA